MINTASTLQHLVEQAGELFSLPSVAVEVLQLTDDPRVDARRLKQAIENDPALTTKVLRVVNSSIYGLSHEVGDLNQALALLGVKPLKLLVLGFSLPDALFADLAGDVLSRYWRTALTKAVTAREISQQFWRLPGDDAFVAGLLDEIGMLVLIQQLGEPYVVFVDRVYQEKGDLVDLERNTLGFDHHQLTAGLLSHWGLPASLVRAIDACDEDEAAPQTAGLNELARMLHLARLVTTLIVAGHHDALPELLAIARRYRGITDAQMRVLLEDLQEKVEQLADVLSLEIAGSTDYRAVLEEARRHLASEAEQAAVDLVTKRRKALASVRRDILEGEETEQLTAAATRLVNDAHTVVTNPTGLDAATAVATSFAPESASPRAMQATSTVVSGSVCEDDPGVLARLHVCVAACRQARRPLSLLLVEVDRYRDLVFEHGPENAAALLRLVEHACRAVDHPNAKTIPARECRFAVVLPDCDRQEAVRYSHGIVHSVRELTTRPANGGQPAMTVSVGASSVTVLPKNFPPEELIQSADRCLYAAQTAGGNGLKSIEIY